MTGANPAESNTATATAAERRRERLSRRPPTKMALIGRLTIDKMMGLWPWGPPHALPQYRYWELSISCDCANRSHRRKDCPVRGMTECHICKRAYEPNGTLFEYCRYRESDEI